MPEPVQTMVVSAAMRSVRKQAKIGTSGSKSSTANTRQKMPHKEIATLLNASTIVPGWWCQMVTVVRTNAPAACRAVHQTTDGFNANASKTLNVSVLKTLYHACADETLRAKWLGRKTYTVARRRQTNRCLSLGARMAPHEWTLGCTPKARRKARSRFNTPNLPTPPK